LQMDVSDLVLVVIKDLVVVEGIADPIQLT